MVARAAHHSPTRKQTMYGSIGTTPGRISVRPETRSRRSMLSTSSCGSVGRARRARRSRRRRARAARTSEPQRRRGSGVSSGARSASAARQSAMVIGATKGMSVIAWRAMRSHSGDDRRMTAAMAAARRAGEAAHASRTRRAIERHRQEQRRHAQRPLGAPRGDQLVGARAAPTRGRRASARALRART